MESLVTQRQKRQIRREKALASVPHSWNDGRFTNTYVYFQCTVCGWKVRLRRGAKHNGYGMTPDEKLSSLLPILDDRDQSCFEKVVMKVMES